MSKITKKEMLETLDKAEKLCLKEEYFNHDRIYKKVEEIFQAVRSLIENQPEVDEKFIKEWAKELMLIIEEMQDYVLSDAKRSIRQLLTEAGVKIKEVNNE